jgi:hypothetical protein
MLPSCSFGALVVTNSVTSKQARRSRTAGLYCPTVKQRETRQRLLRNDSITYYLTGVGTTTVSE